MRIEEVQPTTNKQRIATHTYIKGLGLDVLLSFQVQPLLSSLQLQSVLQLWLQTAPSSYRIQTTVGSSGKEFVMVLNYSRQVPQPCVNNSS